MSEFFDKSKTTFREWSELDSLNAELDKALDQFAEIHNPEPDDVERLRSFFMPVFLRNSRRKYKTPHALYRACLRYFLYAANSPVYAADVVKHKGEANIYSFPKQRVFNRKSLCLFIGMTTRSLEQYASNPEPDDYTDVARWAYDVIDSQTLEHAAAETINPMIGSRLLGLADRQEVTGKDGADLFEKATDEELDNRIKALTSQLGED